jgi:hypothetical protein
MAALRERLSPEAAKKERSQSIWEAVGAIGRGIGSKPGFGAGLAAGTGEAAQLLARSIREQKASEKDLRKEMAALENLSNEEKRALSKLGVDLYSSGVEGVERRRAAQLSQQNQLDVANTYANAKGNTATTPVGETPKGKISLTKDLSKIASTLDKKYSAELEMARIENNPTKTKMLENQRLAEIQKQEDELYAAYGVAPPKRPPVYVPINGKRQAYPNMYSALEAIRAFNAGQKVPSQPSSQGGKFTVKPL